jgi:hypothetical protein
MKKALKIVFTLLAIILITTSCEVQKKITETDFQKKEISDSKKETETQTNTETENNSFEPVDNTKPMIINEKYYYNTRWLNGNEKKDETKNETENNKSDTSTNLNIEDKQVDKQFVLKEIHFLYLFLGLGFLMILNKKIK